MKSFAPRMLFVCILWCVMCTPGVMQQISDNETSSNVHEVTVSTVLAHTSTDTGAVAATLPGLATLANSVGKDPGQTLEGSASTNVETSASEGIVTTENISTSRKSESNTMANPNGSNDTTSLATGSSDTTSQSTGSSDVTSQSMGSSDTTSQSMGSSDTTSQPMGSSDTTSQPMGSSDTTSQPMGSSDTTSTPMGSSDVTSQATGSSDVTSQATGSSDVTSQPMGISDTTSQPMGISDTTSQPMGSSDTTSQPMGNSDTTSQSMGSSDTATLPISGTTSSDPSTTTEPNHSTPLLTTPPPDNITTQPETTTPPPDNTIQPVSSTVAGPSPATSKGNNTTTLVTPVISATTEDIPVDNPDQAELKLLLVVKIDQEFVADLNDTNSEEFKQKSAHYSLELSRAYQNVTNFKTIEILDFRPGSILIDYNLVLEATATTNFTVDTTRLKSDLDQARAELQHIPKINITYLNNTYDGAVAAALANVSLELKDECFIYNICSRYCSNVTNSTACSRCVEAKDTCQKKKTSDSLSTNDIIFLAIGCGCACAVILLTIIVLCKIRRDTIRSKKGLDDLDGKLDDLERKSDKQESTEHQVLAYKSSSRSAILDPEFYEGARVSKREGQDNKGYSHGVSQRSDRDDWSSHGLSGRWGTLNERKETRPAVGTTLRHDDIEMTSRTGGQGWRDTASSTKSYSIPRAYLKNDLN